MIKVRKSSQKSKGIYNRYEIRGYWGMSESLGMRIVTANTKRLLRTVIETAGVSDRVYRQDKTRRA